jgi:hypothetical protein
MMRVAPWLGLFAGLLLAANPGAQTPPETGTGAQAGAASPDRPAAPVEPPPRRTKPKATFKPSERIRADSAVSFPVDI